MARSFNGTTDFINYGTGVPDPGGQVTISFWVRPTSLANAYTGLTSWGDGAVTGCSTYVESNGKLAFYIRDAVGNQVHFDPGSNTLVINTWYHLAFTVTSTGNLAGYVNGSLDISAAGTGSPLANLTGKTFEVGQDQNVGGRLLTGSMADPALWSVVLSASEILALSKGIRPNKIRKSIFYSPVDGLQSPEPDLSGNKNNGTLTGTTKAFGPPFTMFTPRWPQKIETAVAAPAAQFIFTPAVIP